MDRRAGRLKPLLAVLALLGSVASQVWAQAGDQAEKNFAFAQGLYRQENYPLAAEKFVAFIKQYPAHANLSLALFRAGECLFRTGQYAASEPYFQRLTRDFPKSPEAEPGWVWLGDTHFQAKHYEEAVTAYGAYLEKYPQGQQAGRAAYWLGESQYNLGRNAEAIAAYRKALGLKLGEQEAAYARYALGWAYLQTGETGKAAEAFQQVVDKHAASAVAAESQYLLGTAHRSGRDYAAASTAFQKVLTKHAQTKFAAYAQAGLAWCHFDQKAYEAALEAFKQVSARYPESEPAAESRLRAADCQFHLRRFPEAAQGYEAVVAAGGKWTDEALYWLGVTREQLPGQHDQALAAYQRLGQDFRQSPRAAEALLRVGRLRLAAGETAEAVTAYQGAVTVASTPVLKQQAQAYLAWARYRQKPSDKALEEVEKQLQSDLKAIWVAELGYEVALTHFTAERYQPAWQTLERLAAGRPETGKQADVLYLMGACQDKLGDPAKAEDFYRRVLKESKAAEYAGLAGAALVNLYARKGSLEQARKLAEELQKSGATPEARAYALNAVGDAFAKAKQPAEALAAYEKALAVGPGSDSAPYAQLGLAWARLALNDPKAGEAFVTLAQRYPQSPAAQRAPEGLLAAAEKQFEAGQFAEAQAGYERLLAAFPACDLADEARYKRAWALLKQSKLEAALADFTAVAPVASSAAVAADSRYQAGRLLLDKGQAQQAASLLEAFRQQYQESEAAAAALVLLGRAQTELTQYALAQTTFQMVLDRHAAHLAAVEAGLGLGRVQRLQRQLPAALTTLGQVLAGTPGGLASETQFELALTYRDQGEHQTAAEEFLKVAILYGDPLWSARAQYEAGQSYEQLHNQDSAVKSYKIVLRDFPKQQPWAEKAQARLQALGQ